jgi:hypothetical protein
MSRSVVAGAAVAVAATLIGVSLLFTGESAAQPSITYVTSWDMTGIAVADDGSWTVTTDLGYRITVTGGAVVTFSVTAIPCGTSTPLASDGPVGVSGALTDPALLGVSRSEPLRPLTPRELGSRDVPAEPYCQAHMGWGAANGDAVLAGVPSVDTLRLSGTYLAPGATAPTAFGISTALSWGVKADLTVAGDPVVVDMKGPIEITVVRDPSTLFDGIDLAADPDQVERTLLRNLAASTRFIVTEGR